MGIRLISVICVQIIVSGYLLNQCHLCSNEFIDTEKDGVVFESE